MRLPVIIINDCWEYIIEVETVGVPGTVQASAGRVWGGGLFFGDAQNVGDDLQLSHFVG